MDIIEQFDRWNGRYTSWKQRQRSGADELAGYSLFATNYIDDGDSIYLNGNYVGGFRLAPGATYATAALTHRDHSITVLYNGAVDFKTSTSAALTQSVD